MPFLTNPAGRFCYFNTSTITGGGGGTVIRFAATGADQSWTAPAGVYSVTVELYGGNGGKDSATANFGKGGYVSGTMSVTPGYTYTLVVGQAGGNEWPIYGNGGKGFSTNNGGGMSLIADVDNEILFAVAGGGGGGAGAYFGGDGGGPVGQTPSYGDGEDGTAPTGGTNSAGGAGGTFVGSRSGQDGGQFSGGNCGENGGGGGGSGYYGGGGGASDKQPGAGGSSYTGGLSGTIVSLQGVGGDMTVGGNGYIIITIPD
jgi:hypothetical protein